MRNKLTILSFALILSLSAFAQDAGNELTQQPKISIYPNPAIEHITIDLGDSFKNAKFELNSMIGNKILIQPEDLGYGKYRISIKDFAQGYYFLVIKDDETRFKKAYKFLKK